MITDADKQRFIDEGVIRVDNVVPESLCCAVRETICDYLGMTADDPQTWPEQQSKGHGLVPIYHAQALWNVRQHPAVHETFAALHGTEQLWVTYDRVSFKIRDPDQHEASPADPIHWDGDPTQHRKQRSIQGLLYLTDTEANQGAFCCVPNIYQHLDAYLEENPEHGPGRRPVVDPIDIRVIEGAAGSLVLWDRTMPHSSTINLNRQPRWVQYLSMDPVSDEAARGKRVKLFKDKGLPDWAVAQIVPGQVVPEPGTLAELTSLGRRLVGIDRW